MYETLKKIIFLIVPRQVIVKNEFFIRRLYAFFYSGNKVSCSICEGNFRKFQKVNQSDTLCIRCGSIPRQRLLWLYLKQHNLLQKHILHFSPNNFFAYQLKQQNDKYYTSDYDPESVTDFHYDITSIIAESNSYDVVICYHVLEHIIDDNKAMRELHRIINQTGQVLLQVPFANNNKTYEDYSITSKEDRLRAFGQEDHVRIYGKDDFSKRLTAANFNVEEKRCSDICSDEEIKRFDLNPSEIIFICRK